MDILQEIIMQYAHGRNTGKCIELNCPCCTYMGESRNDTRQRGGIFIDIDRTGYNCFNCGFKFRQEQDKPLSKNVKIFLENIGASKAEIQKIMFIYRKNASDNPLSHTLFDKKKVKHTPLDLDFKEDSLPEDSNLLIDILDEVDETHPAFKAYHYAYERGIEGNPYLMWSSSKRSKFHDYLIIPFIYKGKLVGYQARYFGDDVWMQANRRFINSDPNKGKYLYGMENIFSDKKYLIINESLIDAYIYNGIGLMSHNINQYHRDMIKRFKGTVIYTPDFGNASQHLIDIALEDGWGVYYPFWDDGKDLGEATKEYGRLFLTQHIIKNHVTSQMKIKLKRNSLL